MQIKGNCLSDKIEHSYEFIEAKEGVSIWKCQRCGDILHEYEDGLTG
jgi:Zn-finger protein